MNILIIDDEKLLLKHLEKKVKEILPNDTIYSYNNCDELIQNDFIINNTKFDIAFLDIKMNGISGIDFAKKLKEKYPNINIIFTTGYENFAIKAFELNASSYLLKPITSENIKKALQNLRYPVSSSKTESKRIKFQCFGNFEVFIDSKPVNFRFNKTKEMLAFLVFKRGAMCTNEEIITNLWDDLKKHNSYFKQIRNDLLTALEKHNCKELLIKQRAKVGINTEIVECDYYDYLNGDKPTINEFMSQYSWAEEITALLNN